mmetsp:Transcript_39791/g.84823  ORF Transcript_39791/g.84823 Transcript_39791/m.84823 type:complete len:259 (-) Transcript_39791:541-1317(-)
MVNGGVDDAVADGFRSDGLHVLRVVELQLGRSVLEVDTGVGERNVTQPGADHVLSQPHDERGVAVGREGRGVLGHGHTECGEVAKTDRLHQLQVRLHRRSRVLSTEDGALGDLAEQQLYDGTQLEGSELEAEATRLRRLALRLHQAVVGGGVLELESLEPARVVVEARTLGVVYLVREDRLGEELVRLVEELVVLVVAQQQVEQRRLARCVVVEAGGALSGEQRRADRLELAGALVGPRGVEVDLFSNGVERAAVEAC